MSNTRKRTAKAPAVGIINLLSGVELIAKERQRQTSQEGWTSEHDDEHTDGELANAAACYAMTPDSRKELGLFEGMHSWFKRTILERLWPWDDSWWKPTKSKRIRELTKAGALIAAEIDRLQREQAR